MASKLKRTSAKRYFREMGESYGSWLYQQTMTRIYTDKRKRLPESMPVWAKRAWNSGMMLAQAESSVLWNKRNEERARERERQGR